MVFPLFIGTNTAKPGEAGSRGIYSALFDARTGSAELPRLVGEVASPTFLAVHPRKAVLYSSSEVYGGDEGFVTAWKIEPDAGLSLLGSVSSGGRAACFVAVDPRHELVYATNFGTGSVGVFRLREDGGLEAPVSLVQREGSGPVPKAQAQPRPHSVNPHPERDLVVVADLGTDEVAVYGVDPSNGKLLDVPVSSAKARRPGAGPRHVAFHPDGLRFYVVNELDGTVSSFALEPESHRLREIAQFQIGGDDATWASEIRMHPSGRFLVAAARTPGVLTVFAVDETSGELRALQTIEAGGEVARNFEIDPTGAFLLVANNESDRVSAFAMSPGDGLLERREGLDIEVFRPACIRFGAALPT